MRELWRVREADRVSAVEAPPTQESSRGRDSDGQIWAHPGDMRGQASLHGDALARRHWAASVHPEGWGLRVGRTQNLLPGPAREDRRAGPGVRPTWSLAACARQGQCSCWAVARPAALAPTAHTVQGPGGAGRERGRGGACAQKFAHTGPSHLGRGSACRDAAAGQPLLRCRGVGGEASGLMMSEWSPGSQGQERG